ERQFQFPRQRLKLNRAANKTKGSPQLLSKMRHERMKQPQDRVENVIHYCECGFFLRIVLAANVALRSLDKPVAVIAPNKIVQSLRDRIELVIAISRFDHINRLIQAR